ncbi:nickel-dependent hydrogenase large subunit [Aestuariirhabdus litorea]|uniref:Ni,Fe-hydrogenase I large subunit n=1 Tax=Aestuariirhabdus litorea TaxID=2528527 RepID=A0A3P3VML1_9GAMM|nr:nickel-dependent hydrogenase large subunit [Aestuariirhabdus litorea]RRJ83664.1 hypothetical protein D0544_00635 [Aestuariirhabdus litorea]RWW96886.1 hypothetical protein DZC74_00635 [Endozoicomonadaceae bacterium GTF-13]
MIEGKLRILLRCREERVGSVEIISTRPQISGRLLEGDRVSQALSKVPVIYSLCRQAQSLAATLAQGAIEGGEPPPGLIQQARLEALQEHLWRFFIDLPVTLGKVPLLSPFAPIRQQILQQIKALDAAPLYNAPLPWWQALREAVEGGLLEYRLADCCGQGLTHWQQWLASSRAPLGDMLRCLGECLPTAEAPILMQPSLMGLDADALPELVTLLESHEGYGAQPWLAGGHPEAGAIVRHRDHPLVSALRGQGALVLARLVARLLEIDRLLDPAQALAMGSFARGEDGAAGWVETARGILLHRLEIRQGRVHRYQVVAPTEWNFHPEGPLVQAVLALPAANLERLRQQVQLIGLSLDPCVGFEVEVCNA